MNASAPCASPSPTCAPSCGRPTWLNFDQVVAVVLETTGDISVLHGDDPLDPDLLHGVIGVERLSTA